MSYAKHWNSAIVALTLRVRNARSHPLLAGHFPVWLRHSSRGARGLLCRLVVEVVAPVGPEGPAVRVRYPVAGPVLDQRRDEGRMHPAEWNLPLRGPNLLDREPREPFEDRRPEREGHGRKAQHARTMREEL